MMPNCVILIIMYPNLETQYIAYTIYYSVIDGIVQNFLVSLHYQKDIALLLHAA